MEFIDAALLRPTISPLEEYLRVAFLAFMLLGPPTRASSSQSASAPPAARLNLSRLGLLGSSKSRSVCRVVKSKTTFTNPKHPCRNTVIKVAAEGMADLPQPGFDVNASQRTTLNGSTMMEYATGYL